jgi:hypothetical protein
MYIQCYMFSHIGPFQATHCAALCTWSNSIHEGTSLLLLTFFIYDVVG